jgi:hypothetical protein
LWQHLDRIAEHGGRPWPDHWIEGFEERGEPKGRELEVVKKWLTVRGTLRAFEVAAACVAIAANRGDVHVLDCPGAPLGPEADSIRADARFAVYSRSLT